MSADADDRAGPSPCSGGPAVAGLPAGLLVQVRPRACWYRSARGLGRAGLARPRGRGRVCPCVRDGFGLIPAGQSQPGITRDQLRPRYPRRPTAIRIKRRAACPVPSAAGGPGRRGALRCAAQATLPLPRRHLRTRAGFGQVSRQACKTEIRAAAGTTPPGTVSLQEVAHKVHTRRPCSRSLGAPMASADRCGCCFSSDGAIHAESNPSETRRIGLGGTARRATQATAPGHTGTSRHRATPAPAGAAHLTPTLPSRLVDPAEASRPKLPTRHAQTAARLSPNRRPSPQAPGFAIVMRLATASAGAGTRPGGGIGRRASLRC